MPQGLSETYTDVADAAARAQELHDGAGGRRARCFPETRGHWAVVLEHGHLKVCHCTELPDAKQGWAAGDLVVLHRTADTEATWKPSPELAAIEAAE